MYITCKNWLQFYVFVLNVCLVVRWSQFAFVFFLYPFMGQPMLSGIYLSTLASLFVSRYLFVSLTVFRCIFHPFPCISLYFHVSVYPPTSKPLGAFLSFFLSQRWMIGWPTKSWGIGFPVACCHVRPSWNTKVMGIGLSPIGKWCRRRPKTGKSIRHHKQMKAHTLGTWCCQGSRNNSHPGDNRKEE